jgi:uncharacterized protein
MKHKYFLILSLLIVFVATLVQGQPTDSVFVRQNYTKLDRQIPMRDGAKLYTTIYVPKDASDQNRYPFLMERTPYSVGDYGEQNYAKNGPGPSVELSREKYIFVTQDVRGRYKSEGEFEEMTPHGGKTSESTDTFDTIDWLLKNVPNNNGRVGLMGISYPGFYASAALPNAHPALKAVSPQAPVTDEFMGDDARHNGAFFLLDNFSFMNYFDGPRSGLVENYTPLFNARPKDTYDFFLKLGPVKNANGSAYFNNRGKIWNEYVEHDTYDAYWKARNIRPHLKTTPNGPATLVVGGWFDAEDLFGALRTYEAIEKQSPGANNRLVMGPWTHGAWSRADWSEFGPLTFGQNTAKYYRDNLETQFFAYYLKDKGTFGAAEATMFNTGTNAWQTFTSWPARTARTQTFRFGAGERLKVVGTAGQVASSDYVSDPARPVPYTDLISGRRNNQYMIEDQRFASRRPDVLTFQTDVLTDDLTVAGPIDARLFVSTTGSDADFIVKVIDVLPDTVQAMLPAKAQPGVRTVPAAGYQRLVRAEVMRGRFRNSFEKPEPFQSGQLTEVRYQLPDVLHTFKKGHRLMVQVQSSWFPLVDLNPQTYVRMKDATEANFQKATIRFYHTSGISFMTL